MCYTVSMKTIPQRELRNNISRILREVEAGERFRVTVDGRAVADLVPISQSRRRFVPRDEILDMLAVSRADHNLAHEIESVLGQTIDEL